MKYQNARRELAQVAAKLGLIAVVRPPQKRVYLAGEDYYKCRVCGQKLDKKIADKIGKRFHCSQPLTLKQSFILVARKA